MAKAKIRNPYVCLAILRKGGVHQKGSGAERAARKRLARKQVDDALRQAHYLTLVE